MKLPPYPDDRTLPNWKLKAFRRIKDASGRPIATGRWLGRLARATTHEELNDPGDFETLDYKIGTAVQEILKDDELGSKIMLLEAEYTKRDETLGGLQQLWMFLDSFGLNDGAEQLYDLEELLEVRMRKNKLVEFLFEWDTIIFGLRDPTQLNPVTKQTLFWRQVK